MARQAARALPWSAIYLLFMSRYVRATSAPRVQQLPPVSVSRHVVVSIDGLRPDAISTYGAATLQRLMREGSYTLCASTIHPSTTLPSHTSMLTGQTRRFMTHG
jgi:predicted AlkP superfamily pyrophosphatase or phosphodiesterase